MPSEHPDASFMALPASLRTKIDHAFDRAVSGSSSPGVPRTKAKKRAVPEGGFVLPEDEEPAPGGFLLDETPGGFLHDDASGGFIPEAGPSAGGFLPEDTAGGFIVEDEDVEATNDKPMHIALSQIPAALQMLDLPPDDDEVLAVFKNAASGWSDGRARMEEESVSRKDWRAVCAVLLEAEGEGGELDEAAEEDEDEEAPMQEFRPESAEESEGDATSDEYVEEPVKQTRRRSAAASRKSTPQRKMRRRGASPSDTSEDEDEEQERPLTARQKRECLNAFALFFPDLTGEVDEDAVKGKRLGVRELTKAAGALKEKIKVEEMMEMLEAFSTTPDKTMGLADFERMMVSTKMA